MKPAIMCGSENQSVCVCVFKKNKENILQLFRHIKRKNKYDIVKVGEIKIKGSQGRDIPQKKNGWGLLEMILEFFV